MGTAARLVEHGAMPAAIVCGVDDSMNAREATDVALRLAERLALPFELIRVGRADGPGELGSVAWLVDAPVRRLEGPPARRLVAAARRAALLVIGSRGRNARRPAVLGSVADAVIREAGAPVLVVPPGAGDRPLEGDSVVCAVKDADDADCAVVAAELCGALDLQLVLAHAMPRARTADLALAGAPAVVPAARGDRAPVREMLGSVARAAGVARPGMSAPRIVDGPAGPGLVDLADAERAALLVIGAPSHGVLLSALLGSPAPHLLRHAPRPVLVCARGVPGALGFGRRLSRTHA